MAEYQHDDGLWTCSSHQVWLPGVYESRKACRLAYRVHPNRLHELWESKRPASGIVPDGVSISEAELRKAMQEKEG